VRHAVARRPSARASRAARSEGDVVERLDREPEGGEHGDVELERTVEAMHAAWAFTRPAPAVRQSTLASAGALHSGYARQVMGTPWDQPATQYLEEWVPRFVPYHLDLVQELRARHEPKRLLGLQVPRNGGRQRAQVQEGLRSRERERERERESSARVIMHSVIARELVAYLKVSRELEDLERKHLVEVQLDGSARGIAYRGLGAGGARLRLANDARRKDHHLHLVRIHLVELSHRNVRDAFVCQSTSEPSQPTNQPASQADLGIERHQLGSELEAAPVVRLQFGAVEARHLDLVALHHRHGHQQ